MDCLSLPFTRQENQSFGSESSQVLFYALFAFFAVDHKCRFRTMKKFPQRQNIRCQIRLVAGHGDPASAEFIQESRLGQVRQAGGPAAVAATRNPTSTRDTFTP